MTKDEFISRRLVWKRYRDKVGYLWIAGLGLFFLWSYLAAGKTSPLWQICFMIYLLGGSGLCLWLGIRRMRQLGLTCPRCKRMNGVTTRRILATGKCRCGQEIVELHEAA
jgi:hypothetical protein